MSPSITTPANIAAGGSLNINIVFNPPAANPLGPKMANLHVVTNDPDTATLDLYLGGLTTIGEEGDNEPSLQWILDTFRIPVNVGDANVATGPIEGIVLPNSNNIERFVKAGAGVVSIDTLAIFSGDTFAQPAAILGWYQSHGSLTELLRYGSGDAGQHQEMNPSVQSGATEFDPGSSNFGMYSQWPVFPGRTVYLENALNTFDTNAQKHIVFPLRDILGNVVRNAYVVGVEEAANNDFQDLVYIIRNVTRFVPGIPGDYNANNSVDAADYVLLRKNLGQAIALPNENVTLGMVTQEDYETWRANFGMSTGGGLANTLVTSSTLNPQTEPKETGREAMTEMFALLGNDDITNGMAGLLTRSSVVWSRHSDRNSGDRPINTQDRQEQKSAKMLYLDSYFGRLKRHAAIKSNNRDDFSNDSVNSLREKLIPELAEQVVILL